MDIEGDAFGDLRVLPGQVAMKEGQKGGEFFTPTSIVRLIVQIIEPYHARIYDPACGSGGMFVSPRVCRTSKKVAAPKSPSTPGARRRDHPPGQDEPGRPRLVGRHWPGNTYYEDLHNSAASLTS